PSLEQQLSSDLGLTRRPIAIAFRDAPPRASRNSSPASRPAAASGGSHRKAACSLPCHRIRLRTLGRPTCMALPVALAHGLAMSTGCVGNRVYTGADEGELCAAVPGNALAKLAKAGRTINSANAKLQDYHEARRQQLMTEPA